MSPLTSTSPTLLLVEDAPLFRQRLRQLLEEDARFRVAGETGSAAEAIRWMRAEMPGAVILDLQLAEGSGFDVLRELSGWARRPPVIVLTAMGIEHVRTMCAVLGAAAVLDKATQVDQVIPAVECALHAAERGATGRRMELPPREGTRLAGAGTRLRASNEGQEPHDALRRYRALVRESLIAICQTTRDGVMVFANQALARVLGYRQAQELLGRNLLSELCVDPGMRTEVISQVIAGRPAGGERSAARPVEARARRQDGREITVMLSGHSVDLGSGAGSGVEYVVDDVSECVQLESQLRQMQRMEVMGQFAGGLAHDLNNMVCAIMANTEMLRDTLAADGAPQAPELDTIVEATRRARDVLRRMLLFARGEQPTCRPLDLGRVVRDAEPLVRPLVPARVRVELAISESPLVDGDPSTLEQVVLNLLINARDAIPNQGTISVAVRPADRREADRLPGAPRRATVLEVRDSGEGIDASELTRIFEPFRTAKAHGTGLGLFMVRRLVEQHGGEVTVESARGRGTSFIVTLPAAAV